MVGLLYGFFIAILCGQKITNRHYHVLAKQELTKVNQLVMGVKSIPELQFHAVYQIQCTFQHELSMNPEVEIYVVRNMWFRT
jgi:hypothetical protein